MALKPLSISRGPGGLSTLCIPTPVYTAVRTLVADTAKSVTIPSGAKYALFTATGDFYCNYTTTATVPSDADDGTGSELNPTGRTLDDSDTISVISSSAIKVCVLFYA